MLPYLLLSKVDSASREHDLRAIFNAVRYVVKGGNQWRLMLCKSGNKSPSEV